LNSLVLKDLNNKKRHILKKEKPEYLPFLKWAGGKQWLSKVIKTLLPRDFKGNYFEPFLGSASIFFSLKPLNAILSDVNSDLIKTYKSLQDDVERVINELEKYKNDYDFFIRIRNNTPRKEHLIGARLIYLNKTSFNGLYRVNKNGKFNVPFGNYSNPTICNKERLKTASILLKSAKLFIADFEKGIEEASRGDFIYFDPPYVTTHYNNGFLKYNTHLFSWKDQIRLCEVAKSLAQEGAKVLISNAYHIKLRNLYDQFYQYKVERNSLISGSSEHRKIVPEILISSYPLAE